MGQLPDTIILPVETLNREFDAKLHLGLRAVARGWKVIIGGRTALHDMLPRLPRSVYLAKGIRTGNRRILRLIEQFGHTIVALDEEALIRPSDEAHLMMLDEETFNRPRLLYAWGKNNADLWRRFKGYHGTPVLEVGNPRVDMLRPELTSFYAAEVERLRQRFGRFVLLSSNFSVVNHYIPNHVRFKTAKGSDAKRGAEVKTGMVAHKALMFDAFRQLIPGLTAAAAPASLVIRPHPSENAATWQAAAAGVSNVHVAHEGPIAPWIMAADVLVHSGCTSAVEAAIVGTRALAFTPFSSSSFDSGLPDVLSQQSFTADDLIAALSRSLSGSGKPAPALTPQQFELLRDHVASVDGPFCADRILDSLENQPAMTEARAGAGISGRVSGLTNHYLRRARRMVTTRLPGSPSSAGYTAHKFPGIGGEAMSERIARFAPLIRGLPPVRPRRIAQNIFALERDITRDDR